MMNSEASEELFVQCHMYSETDGSLSHLGILSSKAHTS